jgi:hypothetical protein
MRIGRALGLCGLIIAALPPVAHADGYFVPFVGANFGGEVGRPLNIALRDRNRKFQVDDLRLGGVDFEGGTFDFSRASGGVVFRF